MANVPHHAQMKEPPLLPFCIEMHLQLLLFQQEIANMHTKM